MTNDFTVGEIAAADTHDLRRRVLRGGDTEAVVDWVGDDDRTTVHLGASVDGQIVAISTWLDAPASTAPDRRARQLRGMATDPSVAGRGLGRALLDAGVQRARSDGFERAWANARVTALGFYELAGWTIVGPVFETAAASLPHRLVHLDL